MLKIGAHVSSAVQLGLSVGRAKEIGANCFQFFLSPPQQWVKSKHEEVEIEDFKTKVTEGGMGPNFIHGTYLINLATEKSEHLEKSISWLDYALNLAERLDVTGIIFHTGSHGGRGFENTLTQIAQSLNTLLQKSGKCFLILENSAGAGGNIGGPFSQLGKILKIVKSDRLKICLDTCHGFAAGYDLRSDKGISTTLAEFDQEIGLKNLVAIHANDTKFDLGSKKDRHENIGEGFLGREGFKNLLNHKSLRSLPFILEVPGFEGKGPDKKNIDILSALAGK